MTATSRLTILCAGMLAAERHHGGASWAVLQYLLGFRQLGHHVFFVEPIEKSKLRPVGAPLIRTAAGLRFQRLVAAFQYAERSALLLEGTAETVGLTYEALREVAARTDLLVNISGMLTDDALLQPIRKRLYLDLDPGFNQVWHAGQRIDRRFDTHTHFATVGLRVGSADCRVPMCGKTWITTCPPVVLAHWPVARGWTRNAFTTVGNWRSYGSMHYEGLFLGQKAHSLRPLIDLPKRTGIRFELALAIHPAEPDLAELRLNNWNLIDPRRAAGTPGSYRSFVSNSRGEFGIAKSGYVATRSGWFSDRSACYLAAGRPVLAQDTGFVPMLPAGEGLLPFQTQADALAGLDAIQAHYGRHRDAARAIAEQHFDSKHVLTRLLDKVQAAPS
jgi:hypothetical protein